MLLEGIFVRTAMDDYFIKDAHFTINSNKGLFEKMLRRIILVRNFMDDYLSLEAH